MQIGSDSGTPHCFEDFGNSDFVPLVIEPLEYEATQWTETKMEHVMKVKVHSGHYCYFETD